LLLSIASSLAHAEKRDGPSAKPEVRGEGCPSQAEASVTTTNDATGLLFLPDTGFQVLLSLPEGRGMLVSHRHIRPVDVRRNSERW
jgi:hypothetical protein